ncbi:Uma2 family endonuclease [Gloeobacter violaceus]|uniref:Gll4080 protein n=1 Tax=Gloeobacter violaceus (strain ATCC 29082 / PCC 7421) TaxID=251221 RepID=Q7NE02_GLOVI|nr:Uma2 family endonuclease [Gloeobacter violaceus]BAC92021.1 gll4080 [Gloeobacter violaceus PCC 7421]
MTMTVADVEKLQSLYPDHKIELRDGAITIMSPADATSGLIGVEFSAQLRNWVRPRKLGFVFDSNSGFRPPNGDLTAPDVSFVSRERLRRVPRTYAPVVPDLVVEVKSSTDRLRPLVDKLQSYLELGARVGILVDPDQQRVSVYRPEQEPVILEGGDILSLNELLPGWELAIADLWLVEFDEL